MTQVTQHASAPSTPSLQPLLHDLASLVAAPALVLSGPDGQLRSGGVSGWYVGDVRLLDRLEVGVEGSDLELVRASVTGTARHEFAYVARSLGDRIADPTVSLDRVRELTDRGLVERIVVTSVAQDPVAFKLWVDAASDLTTMDVVKRGDVAPLVTPEPLARGLRWSEGESSAELVAVPAPEASGREVPGRLVWSAMLGRGDTFVVELRATTESASLFAGGRPAPWAAEAGVDSADLRVRRTAGQSLADLAGLLLRDHDDTFLAAGSPWFLTLFGRDSLWAARMLVPFDAGLALSTLRVLARRQGACDDQTTEEQPGKILHEVRPAALDLGEQVLPPVYFGSVDATPLFVCTLADAYAWGADRDEVAALLPAARRCLEWVLEQSAGSGWLRYVDQTGQGLSNQGWKDSHDSVQFADGRLAAAPIALCEVQAYAYDAAVRGAALLADFGEPEVPGLVAWAAGVKQRFEEFWVDAEEGGHLAIALDREGSRVDSVTSNMGHVLGTGLLDPARAARVAELLGGPLLDSGFGLRTLSADAPRFSRSSYHGGSVWPHDTAIVIRGLAAEGHLAAAGALSAGLIRAAEGFGHRLPELYGGDSATDVDAPTAYPAACRPQAWSAAAPLAALVAVTGIRVDAARGILSHPARTVTSLGAFRLRGLRVGREFFEVSVDEFGEVHVELAPGSALVVTSHD